MKSFSLSSQRLTEANSALRAQHRLLLVRHFFSISFLCLVLFLTPSHCSWFQPHRKCLVAHEIVGLRSINVWFSGSFFLFIFFRSTSKTRMQSSDWLHQTVKTKHQKSAAAINTGRKRSHVFVFFPWCFGQSSKGKLLKKTSSVCTRMMI